PPMNVRDRASERGTFSLHVPVTVKVRGPIWPTAFSAAVTLAYVPPVVGGQLTVTWACATPGSSKRVREIANAEALNTPRFSMTMLLFVLLKHRSHRLSWGTRTRQRKGASPGPRPRKLVSVRGMGWIVLAGTILCQSNVFPLSNRLAGKCATTHAKCAADSSCRRIRPPPSRIVGVTQRECRLSGCET